MQLGLVVTTDCEDNLIHVLAHDASLSLEAHLQAKHVGTGRDTLYVTSCEGVQNDLRRLEVLLLAAVESDNKVSSIDTYLTAEEFRTAIVPLLNQDVTLSGALPMSQTYEILDRLGFGYAPSLRFEAVGDDAENELQVRIKGTRFPLQKH